MAVRVLEGYVGAMMLGMGVEGRGLWEMEWRLELVVWVVVVVWLELGLWGARCKVLILDGYWYDGRRVRFQG